MYPGRIIGLCPCEVPQNKKNYGQIKILQIQYHITLYKLFNLQGLLKQRELGLISQKYQELKTFFPIILVPPVQMSIIKVTPSRYHETAHAIGFLETYKSDFGNSQIEFTVLFGPKWVHFPKIT